MDQVKKSCRRSAWLLVGALLCPFAMESVYLFFSRWWIWPRDYAGLGVSLLVGTLFVIALPITPRKRVLCLLIYVPAVAAYAYGVAFIAVVFPPYAPPA